MKTFKLRSAWVTYSSNSQNLMSCRSRFSCCCPIIILFKLIEAISPQSQHHKFSGTIHGLGPFAKLFSGIKIVSLTLMKFIVEFINFIQNIAFILRDEILEILLYLYCSAVQQKKYSCCSCIFSNSNASGVFCTLSEYLISRQKSPMTVERTVWHLRWENRKCNVVFEWNCTSLTRIVNLNN